MAAKKKTTKKAAKKTAKKKTTKKAVKKTAKKTTRKKAAKKKTTSAKKSDVPLVGIVGMGYVGLPLAREFCLGGAKVLGFDVNPKTVSNLNKGKSPLKHIPSSDVKEMVDTKNFKVTEKMNQLGKPDALLIAVPTPLTENREPDMQFVEKTCETISKYLRKGQLVVLESTTYPGTTKELMLPILEKSGLKAGRDFHLAYSPEREDPGNKSFRTATIPKVVGGYDKKSLDMAVEIYKYAIDTLVPVKSCEAAEAAKILENTYRCVNIAMVNELKMLFDRMGIDVWEVIHAASTKPFGYKAFYPGPGLGGHCIPIDPFYLTWKARQYGMPTRFIELAGEINTDMPHYVVMRTLEALNDHKKSLKGSKVLVLGLAYKKDIDDVRESPSLELIELLREKGARVDYNDPYIPQTHKQRDYDLQMKSKKLTPKMLQKYDAVLISTDHSEYDYNWVVENSQLVIDTRNATEKVRKGRKKIVKA
ncbi:UDP-N-acetyl-D-glucosamine 6-dehydrogenase [Anaerohalosphaera lusitana]|uniref:UDP-N-acetyl-D-glucosamine 6-dehydrogenase n=1 Tax=Anaerohalosphaera lusitana TaxID=1936003 RepID=A0A1U9NRW4_9BACT|nr:nucleotide sugar dehydrogenase [Anaerohalosphaera lusitana]AQT70340.1 UDP-N-acetyl-D-glucosamine 6-dehydrogenase [Anaerohalosphaera lusitana]